MGEAHRLSLYFYGVGFAIVLMPDFSVMGELIGTVFTAEGWVSRLQWLTGLEGVASFTVCISFAIVLVSCLRSYSPHAFFILTVESLHSQENSAHTALLLLCVIELAVVLSHSLDTRLIKLITLQTSCHRV